MAGGGGGYDGDSREEEDVDNGEHSRSASSDSVSTGDGLAPSPRRVGAGRRQTAVVSGESGGGGETAAGSAAARRRCLPIHLGRLSCSAEARMRDGATDAEVRARTILRPIYHIAPHSRWVRLCFSRRKKKSSLRVTLGSTREDENIGGASFDALECVCALVGRLVSPLEFEPSFLESRRSSERQGRQVQDDEMCCRPSSTSSRVPAIGSPGMRNGGNSVDSRSSEKCPPPSGFSLLPFREICRGWLCCDGFMSDRLLPHETSVT